MVGYENYLIQMIIKIRQCVLTKNHCARSEVKFTVHTYSLCIGLYETYSCLAHDFVAGPASGMVQYRDLVFHPFVGSHQVAFLLKALGRSISGRDYGHISFLVSLEKGDRRARYFYPQGKSAREPR